MSRIKHLFQCPDRQESGSGWPISSRWATHNSLPHDFPVSIYPRSSLSLPPSSITSSYSIHCPSPSLNRQFTARDAPRRGDSRFFRVLLLPFPPRIFRSTWHTRPVVTSVPHCTLLGYGGKLIYRWKLTAPSEDAQGLLRRGLPHRRPPNKNPLLYASPPVSLNLRIRVALQHVESFGFRSTGCGRPLRFDPS